MYHKFKKCAYLLCILCLWLKNGYGQTYNAQLLDQENKAPIPYAAIVYGQEQGVITNEEGHFTFTIDQDTRVLDSVYISCMGYQKKGFTLKQLATKQIYLKPGGFNLIGVDLMGKGLSALEIIERMIAKIPDNYNQMPVQKKFFLRQSTFDELQQAKIKIKESTIPHINPLSVDSIVNALPKKSEYHTETLGMLYKTNNAIKMQVDKATELYDKKKQATFSSLNYNLKRVLKKYVKPDSYFKIKSGPVATKLSLDSIIGRPELALKLNDSIQTSIKLNYAKSRLHRLHLIENQVFGKKTRLDLVRKYKKYQYYKDETIERDGERYYVLQFKPKKGAKLKGTLYINTADFALVRIVYENTKPLKAFNLFGINYNEPVYKGWATYEKMNNGKYELAFSKLEHDFYLDAARPLKIAEKNKNVEGRRKQNEVTLDLYLTAKVTNSFEWVALESKGSSQSMFDMVPQNKVIEVAYKKAYDSIYWQDNTIIPATSSLKEFAIVD